MQFQGEMSSSKEALDLDGSKSKGRAPKVGSVWETRIMANQLKTDEQRIRSRSNAEIEVDKQSSSGPCGRIKKVEIARQRSDLGVKNKTPLQMKRTRSAVTATSVGGHNNLRKLKSDSAANSSKPLPLQLVEAQTLSPTNLDSTKSDGDKTVVADSETNPVKAITENGNHILIPLDANFIDEEEKEEEEKEKEMEMEVEVEVEVEKEMDEEVEKKSVEIKQVIMTPQEQKPRKGVILERKALLYSSDRSPPLTEIVKRRAPAAKLNPSHEHGTSSRLQSLADLIMWRDVSRSAFVFGIGSFAIISSSYTKDLNISCISVLSYLGLVYLAASFIFRSLISRGNVDMDNTNEDYYVVGEEEAVWLIKLVLPYVNESLSKLRTLFSGDPATTIKLAVMLFILARCGSSITIWKMTKLGFFGVFILPKLSSSYSSHLAAYGTFWMGRLEDAWESCSHKKAVAFGIFSLVWNLCSVVSRIWALFLLFVAFRYYHHSHIKK